MVIHIGMPKTGSTAIQDALAANRDRLAESGVHYPRSASKGSAHHPLAWSVALHRRPRDDVKSLSDYMTALKLELQNSSGIAILSSEALFHLPSQELRQILEWARTLSRTQRLLVYVRPPAAFHEAWYRQLVKTSKYSRTFEEHLRMAPIVDSLTRLESAEGAIGRSRLLVRPYIRSAFTDGDVIGDFCSTLGIGPVDWKTRLADANPSLDVELVEFKVRLHKLGVDHSPLLASALLDWSSRRKHSSRSLFTPQSWEAFIATTEPRHLEVLRRYGLPAELTDQQPSQLTGHSLTTEGARRLYSEFGERYPAVARASFDRALAGSEVEWSG